MISRFSVLVMLRTRCESELLSQLLPLKQASGLGGSLNKMAKRCSRKKLLRSEVETECWNVAVRDNEHIVIQLCRYMKPNAKQVRTECEPMFFFKDSSFDWKKSWILYRVGRVSWAKLWFGDNSPVNILFWNTKEKANHNPTLTLAASHC